MYDYFLRLPRIRFLVADDPGAGKTIMAGLLLKELKARGLIRRTLIALRTKVVRPAKNVPCVEFELSTPITEKEVRGSTVSRKATCVCCSQ